MTKSSPEQIRARFDRDVERFSNLDKGQEATMDAPLGMELVARAAAGVTPHATRVLDVGCGAGNYTLKLLQYRPALHATLLDLSLPMLERAEQRVLAAGAASVTTWQGDVRQTDLGEGRFDIILAAAVLHHLRTDQEWHDVFGSFHRTLSPGGSLWVFDLVAHEMPGVHEMMWARYGQHLTGLGGDDYRKKVMAYVEEEDSPRPLTYQLELMGRVGFAHTEVLHKNGPFAAFGAVKA